MPASAGARVKDVIETKLKRLVCARQPTITLAEAQTTDRPATGSAPISPTSRKSTVRRPEGRGEIATKQALSSCAGLTRAFHPSSQKSFFQK